MMRLRHIWIMSVLTSLILLTALFCAGCGFIQYKEYSDENADTLSAYRLSIFELAEESYDKHKYPETQNKYFDGVFAEFSDKLYKTNDKEEMDELLQSFYFDVHKEDEILSLTKYVDISTYDESQKEILTVALNKCSDEIRGCDNEEDIAAIKDAYFFEVYKRDTVKKLNEYIDLLKYREEQIAEIQSILTEQIKLAEDAETYIEEDNIFRDYQIAVYSIPTEQILYNQELASLKEELISSLANAYKLSIYRENESLIIHELLQSFNDSLFEIKEKESVLLQYYITKSQLDSVKTANDLCDEERLELIEELYNKLHYTIYSKIEPERQSEYLSRAESVYLSMCDRVSVEGIRQEYRQFAYEIGVIDIFKEDLQEYNADVVYRDYEQQQVTAIKEKYLSKFSDSMQTEEARFLLQEAKNAIDEIKTNDDFWSESVAEFRTRLKSLYGEAILEEPESLTEANDYHELAKIIDYYAFYQLSDTEFICDTFRVKLNFDHDDAWTELVNVYWYCELIRTAVGITSYFENNGNHLVCQLIPYDFASTSNERPALNRLNSAIEFNSDKSKMTARSNEFDDFGYYKYSRMVNVWNSQQLWYALEHEYVPICASGSPAELVMNRAKEILREIIMEGMSDEEKIFCIYKWFGENMQFDSSYKSFFDTSDPVLYPDEKISSLRSAHVEGPILDGLTICYGCAKANLMFLRIEGIESYYVFGSSNINSIGYKDGGEPGHAFNYIRLKNNWFMGDVERSFGLVNSGVIYGYLLLPAYDKFNTFSGRTSRSNSKLWSIIEAQASNDMSIYKNLSVNNISIYVDADSFKYLIESYNSGDSFSVFVDLSDLNDVLVLIEKMGERSYIKLYFDSIVEIYIT